MYTISKAAEITGVSAHTLRYYEKIGLLPAPDRNAGRIREYTDKDIHFITFLHSLKNTGMSLEDISEFVKDGCILTKINEGENVTPSLSRRIEILSKHLTKMEQQRRELDQIISLTQEKLSFYQATLHESKDGDHDEA
ncbi:MerR family transcriptional regulator [Brevibacillus dissolubilis]|uniref:MerR family transcriptional regulator n=1 Tax=Brevibacillus dissolubilis TaxID=1844116 RepID=UPI00111633CB|nr:MerR family transcriptional regulator [Brevibacillus dissolubilis]